MLCRAAVVVSLCLLVTVSAFAVTVGYLPPAGSTTLSRTGAMTILDIAHPATEAGSVSTATVRWDGAPSAGCANAFKLKFLRPVSPGFTVVADRGPFNVVNGFNTVTLSPAVSLNAGDLIAVVQLSTTCGGASMGRGGNEATFIIFDGDPTTATMPAPVVSRGLVPPVRASSEATVLEGYLPVVGATAGGFGSQFKTGMQLTNPDDAPLSVKLQFHPTSVAGSDSDPFINYTLAAFQTISVDNVMQALNRTGVGSLDIYSINSSAPLVTSRVYTDAGNTLGTAGFSQEMLTPADALNVNDHGALAVPSDPINNFRVNIGIRTLGAGATILVTLINSTGVLLGSNTRTYPANYFEQVSLSQFVNNVALPSGGHVAVVVTAGNAILYGTTNDNRTNDPLLTFFKRY